MRAVGILAVASCYAPPPDLCAPGARCVQLEIATVVAADLDDVPILVPLDAAHVDYAAIGDPKTDLRFHDYSTDTDLAFDIDRWTPGGESDVWISLPHLHADPATRRPILYFGADAHGVANSVGVWRDDAIVAHLGPALADAANPLRPVTAPNVAIGDGMIGADVVFAGSGEQRVDFADTGTVLDAAPAFTIELWIWPDYSSADQIVGEPVILSKQGSLNNGRLFFIAPDTAFFQLDIVFSDGSTEFLNTAVPLRTWSSLVYTYDGFTLSLYLNGILVPNAQQKMRHPTLASSTQPIVIGSSSGAMQGGIDEVRISPVARSVDWIRQQVATANHASVTLSP